MPLSIYVDSQGHNSSCEIIPYYKANGRLRSSSVSRASLLATPSAKQGDGLVAPTQETTYSRFVICIALKLRLFPCFLVPGFKTRKIFFSSLFFQFHALFIHQPVTHWQSIPCFKTFSPKFLRKDILPGGVFVGFFSNIALRQKFGNAKQSLHKAAWLGFATQNLTA